ncbi:MAG: OmpA family protein [Candidatus Omnitrophota bacterium]|nr:OmpA family protein [Candidatus Omnitrophota bacterium]
MLNITKKVFVLILIFSFIANSYVYGRGGKERAARKQREIEKMQKRFEWWPTDATPRPVKDKYRSGYWWWPTRPGEITPWGNRGYVYLYKIIYDYKAEELPPAKPEEPRPSLLIKKIIKNIKVYFDFDKAGIRDDAVVILERAVKTLKKNPEATILITGNCDRRGPEAYNLKLGKRRGDAIKNFMLERNVSPEHILIVSRGKLDAVAPITDLVGMQKDRNAQFMIAEVQEVMLSKREIDSTEEAVPLEEGKYILEKKEVVETEVRVSTKEYIIKKNDSLWDIAKEQLGSGHRWKYLYELNKDRIKNPDRLEAGTSIIIPIE